MPAFLEDITPFLGENRPNEQGLGLDEFLEDYDPNKYPNPSVTADILVFWANKELRDISKDLKLLLIRRKNHPSIGWWALPGGFVELREDADKAAKRELMEETGLSDVSIEQLCAWGDYNRDPRTRIVTIAYIALLNQKKEVQAGDDAQEAAWFDVSLNIIRTFREDNREVQEYELKLIDPETKVSLSATVVYSYRVDSILKEERYEVASSNHIAFDHPSFIVKGLLHIQNRLKIF